MTSKEGLTGSCARMCRMRADTSFKRWESEAGSSYTISEVEGESGIEGISGTRIELTLREDADEYLDDMKIKALVQRYSEFINFPIKVPSKFAAESRVERALDRFSPPRPPTSRLKMRKPTRTSRRAKPPRRRPSPLRSRSGKSRTSSSPFGCAHLLRSRQSNTRSFTRALSRPSISLLPSLTSPLKVRLNSVLCFMFLACCHSSSGATCLMKTPATCGCT